MNNCMKSAKRATALALMLLMLFGLFPSNCFSAFAEDEAEPAPLGEPARLTEETIALPEGPDPGMSLPEGPDPVFLDALRPADSVQSEESGSWGPA